jgi:DNA-damage-inducible protein J
MCSASGAEVSMCDVAGSGCDGASVACDSRWVKERLSNVAFAMYRNCGTVATNTEAAMPKTATINVRVDEAIKAKAEKILSKIGISTSDTVNAMLHQIVLQNGLPFELRIPNAETQKAMRDLEAGLGEKFTSSTKDALDAMLKSAK